MKSPTTLVSLLLLSTLAGCAGTVQTYSGDAKSDSQIAVVKSRAHEFVGSGSRYFAFFASYAKLEPGQKPVFQNVGNEFTGYPKELRMLPGKYMVMIRCGTQGQFAFPSFNFEAVAGATYEVICEPVANQLSTVKATVEKIDGQK